MLKDQPSVSQSQDAIKQVENPQVSTQGVKKGCGCKNKKVKLTKEQQLQDLHEKMKKTKYL